MQTLRTQRVLALVAALSSTTVACDDAGENQRAAPRSGNVDTSTLRLDLALPPTIDESRAHAIAGAAQELAGRDVQGVKVQLQRSDAAATTLKLSLWGQSLVRADDVIRGLRTRFPELADAHITQDVVAGAPEAAPLDVPEADPELAAQEIRDRLRAEGVEGEVDVQVSDDEKGRRVEVRVEKAAAQGTTP